MNEVQHICQFCKKDTVILTWESRLFKCSCGVIYQYQPYECRPGRGFAERQAAKAKNG